MFIILSILLLIIIYILLSPYPPIYERLDQECPKTQPHPVCDANTINNIKNQINILELKIDGLKKELGTTKEQVGSNKQEIIKFNGYIAQLQKELKDAEKKSG